MNNNFNNNPYVNDKIIKNFNKCPDIFQFIKLNFFKAYFLFEPL